MEWHGILIQKIEKWSETHETLVDVMSCNQDNVVKKLAAIDERLDTHPSKNEATHLKVRGCEREQCMFDDKLEIASTYGLQIFS